MNSFFADVANYIKKHRQIVAFIICLCVSFFLWLFITYGREYEHNISYPITFIDGNNQVEYHTQDSIITIGVKSNGFEFIAKILKKKERHIVVDINKLNIDLSKGKITVPVSRIKPQIMQSLGYRGVDISIYPPNINLTWQKLYSKKVRVVNKCIFKYNKPFEQYKDPVLPVDYVVIEGLKEELNKIDTVYTQNITFNNIDKNITLFVPLDFSNMAKGVVCHTKSIPVKIYAEAYTEEVISVPVKAIRYEDYRNIKIFPKQIKLRYRVAVKDYTKINPKDINAFVLCSDDMINNGGKLKVNLGNIPEYMKVVRFYPEKVEYMMFK